jgi:hypothetical protein
MCENVVVSMVLEVSFIGIYVYLIAGDLNIKNTKGRNSIHRHSFLVRDVYIRGSRFPRLHSSQLVQFRSCIEEEQLILLMFVDCLGIWCGRFCSTFKALFIVDTSMNIE